MCVTGHRPGQVIGALFNSPVLAYRLAMTEFLKMHGLGNDFIIFDWRRAVLTPCLKPRRVPLPTGAVASAVTRSL